MALQLCMTLMLGGGLQASSENRTPQALLAIQWIVDSTVRRFLLCRSVSMTLLHVAELI